MVKNNEILEQTNAIISQTINNELVFLLVEERGGGLWSLPGGAREPEDESLETTMRRELKEELGLEQYEYELQATNIQAQCFYNNPGSSRYGKTGMISLFFVRPYDMSKLKATSDLERIQWVPLGEAKKMFTFDCHRELIDKAAKEITSTHITHSETKIL